MRIIGLLITDRIKEAGKTQETLSRFGHIIKSRLGFHEVTEDKCSRVGFILLHVTGNPAEIESLEHHLGDIEGLEIQKMVFNI